MTQSTPNDLFTHRKNFLILPWIICGIGALFYGYDYLLQVTPGLTASSLMFSLHIQRAVLFGNLVAFYYYIFVPLQIPVGMLMDRFGTRRTLTAAVLCCALGAYFFASTNSIFMANFGEFMIGFGSAFAFIGLLKLAMIWLPETRFGLITGVVMAIGMVGAVVGDVMMARMLQVSGWREVYLFLAGFGVVIGLLLLFLLRQGAKRVGRQRYHTVSRMRYVVFGLLTMVRNSQVWVNGLIGCFLYLPLITFGGVWGIAYLRAVYHLTNVRAAALISLLFLGWAVGAPVMGWLADTIKQRRMLLTVGASLAAIFFALLLYFPNLPIRIAGVLLFLAGLTLSCLVIVFIVSKELSLNRVTGATIGLTNTFVVASGLVMETIIGWLLDVGGKTATNMAAYPVSDYQTALIILPISLVAAVFLSFILQETACKGF